MKDVFIVAIVFGMVSWVTWVIASNIRKGHVARNIAELHAKLLDKCASNQDLLTYLESEPGRRFLESSSTTGANPPARILNAIQTGFIFALLGLAMVLVRLEVADWDVRQFLVVCGSLALSVGLGFLLSAGVSYKLCMSWGLMRMGDARR